MDRAKSLPGPVEIVLPATSANLGPAFDTAALAMTMYLRVRARPAARFSVTARGRDRAICGSLRGNLVLQTYREVLSGAGKAVIPLALSVTNEIPVGKGCGSSAAARIAGILLACRFGRLRWSEEQILAEAASREGHLDNTAACWHGGLVIAQGNGHSRPWHATPVKIYPRANWPLLLAVPRRPLSTEEARRLLPLRYLRSDVVANIQSVMLLMAAFQQARGDLLLDALQDRVHQPYREALCPLLPCLRRLCGRHGILGVALSGAGPSVLLVLKREASAAQARRAVAAHLRRSGLAAELILTRIAMAGTDWGRSGLSR